MNRSTAFRFIADGKLNIVRALYSGRRFNIIPTFYSSDLDEFMVIGIDNEMCLVLNNKYENSDEDAKLNIKISYALLKNVINNEATIDALNAYWYGFNSTLEVIDELTNIDKKEKDIRIRHLNELMISNENIKVPNRDSVLQSIKYIEVN